MMKNNLFKLAVICILLQVQTKSSQGQTPSPFFPKPPTSPNSSDLRKFGAVPVSYYSGLAIIYIPLYMFKYRDFTLQITLNYHGGVMRINDVSSLVFGIAITAVVTDAAIGGVYAAPETA